MTRDAVLLACGFLVGVWAGASLCSRRWMREHNAMRAQLRKLSAVGYTRRTCEGGGSMDGTVVVSRANGRVWVLAPDGGYELDERESLVYNPALRELRVGS
jgi:hypothetical protein